MAPLPTELNINVRSTLPSGGSVEVTTDTSQPVEVLIIAFCMERAIPQKDDYVIRKSNGQILDSSRRFSTYGIKDGDELFLGVRGETERWFCGCTQWWLLAAVTFIIGAVGLTAVTVLQFQIREQPVDYSIVFDAGSSHTQLYVYYWNADKLNNTGKVLEAHTCRAEGAGISSYAANPEHAGPSLDACLKEASSYVPEHGDTPVFLGATAGMRLLESAQPSVADRILQSVRNTLGNSTFKFNDSFAQVITGKSEGAYAWVSTNYLTDAFFQPITSWWYSLSSTTPKSYGAMDLGGASTQITFIPEHPDAIEPEDKEELVLYGTNYDIYSHSYLCYGLNEALRKYQARLVKNSSYSLLIEDPCRPTGNSSIIKYSEIFEAPCSQNFGNKTYQNRNFNFTGTSDAEKCRDGVSSIFDFSCAEHSNCTFNGTNMPPVYGSFYALSGFYQTMKFFNVSGTNSSLVKYRNITENWCKKSWKMISLHQGPKKFLLRYCFDAQFIDVLLTDAYHFTEKTWSNIHFEQKVEDTNLGWSLGFMLNATNLFPTEFPQRHISTAVFIVLLVIFILFLLLSVCFCCYARRASQKDQDVYRRLENYGSL